MFENYQDEFVNYPCTAAEEMRSKLIIGDPEEPEELTLEENVVDDYLTLDNDGERLVLETDTDQKLVLANSEFHSKQNIRDFEVNVRDALVDMAYTISSRIRAKIHTELKPERAAAHSDKVMLSMEKMVNNILKSTITRLQQEIEKVKAEKREVIYLLPEAPFAGIRQSGWGVVDVTWKRGPLHLSKDGWLSTASENYGPTVFATEQGALKAIADTHAFNEGVYGWSNNEYVAVELH